MELLKNIFFDTDKLIQGSTVKISYTGKFFEDASEEVFIHYGFGENWDNLSELKMEKTDLGFQTAITLLESDTFNFCFRNGNNEWDNNDSQNYVFELEAPCTDLVLSNNGYNLGLWITTQKTNYNKSILSEDRIEKLEEIGMIFEKVNDNTWNKMYELAKKYYEHSN